MEKKKMPKDVKETINDLKNCRKEATKNTVKKSITQTMKLLKEQYAN